MIVGKALGGLKYGRKHTHNQGRDSCLENTDVRDGGGINVRKWRMSCAKSKAKIQKGVAVWGTAIRIKG